MRNFVVLDAPSDLGLRRVHVDADVLDPSVMPRRQPAPDGLLPDELVALLRPLLATPPTALASWCPPLRNPDR